MSINDANCLDLFSGAGVFGFEALSRGAAKVVMVDKNKEVVEGLVGNRNQLDAESLEIVCEEIPSTSLKETLSTQKFDIVFIDPPFHRGLVTVACDFLVQADCLAPNALVYVETESELELVLPEGWEIIRAKKAGKVKYYLVKL